MQNQFACFKEGDLIHTVSTGPVELFRIFKKGPKATVVIREDGSGKKEVLEHDVFYGPYLAQV
jgi:hypothetical protein